jgi:hypothetical protein
MCACVAIAAKLEGIASLIPNNVGPNVGNGGRFGSVRRRDLVHATGQQVGRDKRQATHQPSSHDGYGLPLKRITKKNAFHRSIPGSAHSRPSVLFCDGSRHILWSQPIINIIINIVIINTKKMLLYRRSRRRRRLGRSVCVGICFSVMFVL